MKTHPYGYQNPKVWDDHYGSTQDAYNPEHTRILEVYNKHGQLASSVNVLQLYVLLRNAKVGPVTPMTPDATGTVRTLSKAGSLTREGATSRYSTVILIQPQAVMYSRHAPDEGKRK